MALGGVIIASKDSGMCDKLSRTLMASGIDVLGIATSGASALQNAVRYYGDNGVLLCSYALGDMTAAELYRLMPEGFQMVVLLSARQKSVFSDGEMLCLDIPIRRSDLIDTVRMLTGDRPPENDRSFSQRSESDKAVIEKAKALLMERNNLSEPEAHRFLQKMSMNTGQTLVSVANHILNGAV
jgi:Response regulator with putative antiterminator output domain